MKERMSSLFLVYDDDDDDDDDDFVAIALMLLSSIANILNLKISQFFFDFYANKFPPCHYRQKN